MKVLGYIDDLLSWFFSWQYSIGSWNWIVAPIEILIIIYFYLTFRGVRD